jgi:maltooligosyltrehalose trehalohydrolase
MLAWYRELIALRKASPELNDSEPGNVSVTCDPEARSLVATRGSIQVLCNLGTKAYSFPLPGDGQILLSSRDGIAAREDVLDLPPDTVAIVKNVCL